VTAEKLMVEPGYVRIAGGIARRIRSDELQPGAQLPSRAELAEAHGVSEIVAREAIGLLRSQGLVRSVERRGVFVAQRPSLLRVSPERQLETAEDSFANESGRVDIERYPSGQIPAPDDIAELLGLTAGGDVAHVMTCITVEGRPVTISDSYWPPDIDGVNGATVMEETLSIRPPTEGHGAYLGTPPGELVVTIRQQFLRGDQPALVANVTYPLDRYSAYVFRMPLPNGASGPDRERDR
jgi:GntR family transcriptional regulator